MPLSPESRILAETDRFRRSDAWIGFKHITAITKENLKRGNGPIEFLPQNIMKGGENSPINDGPIVHFGKHAGKTVKWVSENDVDYMKWLRENVKAYKNL